MVFTWEHLCARLWRLLLREVGFACASSENPDSPSVYGLRPIWFTGQN